MKPIYDLIISTSMLIKPRGWGTSHLFGGEGNGGWEKIYHWRTNLWRNQSMVWYNLLQFSSNPGVGEHTLFGDSNHNQFDQFLDEINVDNLLQFSSNPGVGEHTFIWRLKPQPIWSISWWNQCWSSTWILIKSGAGGLTTICGWGRDNLIRRDPFLQFQDETNLCLIIYFYSHQMQGWDVTTICGWGGGTRENLLIRPWSNSPVS